MRARHVNDTVPHLWPYILLAKQISNREHAVTERAPVCPLVGLLVMRAL